MTNPRNGKEIYQMWFNEDEINLFNSSLKRIKEINEISKKRETTYEECEDYDDATSNLSELLIKVNERGDFERR